MAAVTSGAVSLIFICRAPSKHSLVRATVYKVISLHYALTPRLAQVSGIQSRV